MIVGSKLIPLLYETLSAGIAPEFTSKLLTYLAALRPGQKNPVNDLGNIDTLSQREMDVLKLLSEGLTNQEIAQKLYLSTNTIKSHSIKIYRKLNVNNRGQAVSKARLLASCPPNNHQTSHGNMGATCPNRLHFYLLHPNDLRPVHPEVIPYSRTLNL